MSRMSGIEISSSQGLKKPPKISPREVSFSSHGLILRFFSTRGMKKFLYLTSTAIRKTYSCLSLYMWKICFFREIVMRTRYPGGNYHFLPGDECTWRFYEKNVENCTLNMAKHSKVLQWSQKICENIAGHYFAYIDSNRNRFSEWAGFQVWKFLHPKGCKKPLN